MSHVILHKKQDGGIASHPPNPRVVALMMASGLGWDDAMIERQVAVGIQPVTAEAALAGKQTYTSAMAREWATAMGKGGLTEAAVFDLFARRVQARNGYTSSVLIDDTQLPDEIIGDRYFRDGIVWDDSTTNKCLCDMDRCRTVHLGHIRRARNAELVKEDINMLKAIEAEDASAQSTVATKKQVLRDIPATFDITTDVDTPAKLKAKWPTELPARE